mmetsp:Transcript_9144/g.41589  ORF Transcript_9144/g.41589 Transcript_9144/m.41589 type:complete len:236 (-) Transcript_9144:1296-2003(-)
MYDHLIKTETSQTTMAHTERERENHRHTHTRTRVHPTTASTPASTNRRASSIRSSFGSGKSFTTTPRSTHSSSKSKCSSVGPCPRSNDIVPGASCGSPSVRFTPPPSPSVPSPSVITISISFSSSPPSMCNKRPFANGWQTMTASSSTTSRAPSSCVTRTMHASVTVPAASGPLAATGADTCDGGGGSRWRMNPAPMASAAASSGSRRITACASSLNAPIKSSRRGFTTSVSGSK